MNHHQRARKPYARNRALLFALNFFKHPRMLGSLIPSSRFLIGQVLGQVDWAKARVIVEYGPGVGTITSHILRRMHPDAKLVVIEMNADFVRYLRTIGDPRLHVVDGSAADVATVLRDLGLERADYVISGIPFSTMPPEVRDAILAATRDVLRPRGQFLVYQFSKDVEPHLKREFSQVRSGFEPLNVLPARLWFCTP